MELSNAHPIFDSVVTDLGISEEQLLGIIFGVDQEMYREGRLAAHTAWLDQLDAKHGEAKARDSRPAVKTPAKKAAKKTTPTKGATTNE